MADWRSVAIGRRIVVRAVVNFRGGGQEEKERRRE